MAVCQNLVPLVNIKIAGKWMFIPLKMVLIGIDPYPYTMHGMPCMEHLEENPPQDLRKSAAHKIQGFGTSFQCWFLLMPMQQT